MNKLYFCHTEVISNAIFFIVCAAPLQKKRARVARDSTIFAKNNTFGYFDGANPITGKNIQLRSSSPIMAPGYIFKKITALSGG